MRSRRGVGYQRPQPVDQRARRAAETQGCIRMILDRSQIELLQPIRLRCDACRLRYVAKRPVSPHIKGLGVTLHRPLRASAGAINRRGRDRLRPGCGISAEDRRIQHVSGRRRPQGRRCSGRAQPSAQTRYANLQRIGRLSRGLLRPQGIDQMISRDRTAGMDKKFGEEPAISCSRGQVHALRRTDAERSKKINMHGADHGMPQEAKLRVSLQNCIVL
jgi:hypothetical protein